MGSGEEIKRRMVAGLRYCDKFWIYVAISGNRSRRWYVAKLIRGDQIDDVRCFVLLGVHEAAAVDCSLITHRAAGRIRITGSRDTQIRGQCMGRQITMRKALPGFEAGRAFSDAVAN